MANYIQTNKHVTIHWTDVILCMKSHSFHWENVNFDYSATSLFLGGEMTKT